MQFLKDGVQTVGFMTKNQVAVIFISPTNQVTSKTTSNCILHMLQVIASEACMV